MGSKIFISRTVTDIQFTSAVRVLKSNSFTGFAGQHLCLPAYISTIEIEAFSDSLLKTIFIDKNVELMSTSNRSPFYSCDRSLKVYTNAETIPEVWTDNCLSGVANLVHDTTAEAYKEIVGL